MQNLQRDVMHVETLSGLVCFNNFVSIYLPSIENTIICEDLNIPLNDYYILCETIAAN